MYLPWRSSRDPLDRSVLLGMDIVGCG